MFKTILSNFHLEKVFWIIKKKLKFMILAGVFCALLGAGFAYYTQTSTYVASISFYVYSNPDYVTDTGVNISTSDISQANTLLDSYMQIIKSRTFLEEVRKEAGLEKKYSIGAMQNAIGAVAVERTAVFNVSVYDEDPVNAMQIANAIGKLAPDEIISIVKSGGIEILDQAELPTVPYASTSIVKYTVVGAAAGIFLVAFIVLLRGLLNTTVRRMYEIEDMFTIPILGTVPLMEADNPKQKVDVVLKDDSPFSMKESYSNIRANLLFTGKGEKCPVYIMTSADTNEGKSMNLLNIAISYAQMQKRVLYIDADLRKSRLKEALDLKDEEGLSEYLASMNEELNVISFVENMDVIAAGKVPPNPAELLSGKRWDELIAQKKEEYDAIFIDVPPVGVVADALVMTSCATAFILVVREMVTHYERTEMIVSKLEAIDADICGFVYNGIAEKSPDYNYKKYGKEYAN